MKFEIENVFKVSKRGHFIAARQIVKDITCEFQYSAKYFLGGYEVKFIDVPRALDHNGEQRFDLFIFKLERDSDADKLIIGTLVYLIPDE